MSAGTGTGTPIPQVTAPAGATLADIREQWVKDSGRYDRLNADGTDNGANSVINRAIRFLEMRLEEGGPLDARYIEANVSAGVWFVKAPSDIKVLKEAWAATSSDGVRWKLCPVTMQEYREMFPTMVGLSNGTPSVWTPAKGRLSDGNRATEFTGAADYEDTFRGVDFDGGYQGILIGCPPEEELTVSMWGKFYSATLVADTDTNWWLLQQPQLVMQAASFIEEVALRNRSGQQDWMGVIDMMLEPIRFDAYEEESEIISGWRE